MGNEERQNYNIIRLSKRLVIVLLVVVFALTAVWILDNETITAPYPKPVLIWNSLSSAGENSINSSVIKNIKEDQSWFSTSLRNTTRETDQPFDYLRTTQWAKQNKTAWKLIYGDLSCADNSKREAMNEILKTWFGLVQKYNIHFSFVYGSLIGIVRNNDIIPWDHDIDVYVEHSDVLKLEKAGWPRDVHNRKGKTIVNYIPNSEHTKPVDERIRWDCQGKVRLSLPFPSLL